MEVKIARYAGCRFCIRRRYFNIDTLLDIEAADISGIKLLHNYLCLCGHKIDNKLNNKDYIVKIKVQIIDLGEQRQVYLEK